ncbi:MAG: hypothetical protein K0R71_2069 [Bacillales bacterium]|jgi:hypothetical protein|nr:hypothetical protein [Bacillales bacterium]
MILTKGNLRSMKIKFLRQENNLVHDFLVLIKTLNLFNSSL